MVARGTKWKNAKGHLGLSVLAYCRNMSVQNAVTKTFFFFSINPLKSSTLELQILDLRSDVSSSEDRRALKK